MMCSRVQNRKLLSFQCYSIDCILIYSFLVYTYRLFLYSACTAIFLQHNVQCVSIAAIFRIHNSFQPRYRHHSQVGLIISFSFETQGEIYYRLYYLLFLCKNNNKYLQKHIPNIFLSHFCCFRIDKGETEGMTIFVESSCTIIVILDSLSMRSQFNL